ncbi:MAG TPA: DUF3592 domain-containing protein [Cyclobacteriaceae bacterium]|nr:DUF3592 domain-containing protein [Cyclobacteriaceae bacterium]
MKKEISEEQQEEFEFLVLSNKLEAIRYAQQNFGLDAEQAITMVERTEQKIDGDIEIEHKKTIVQVPNIVGGVFSIVGIILVALGSYFGYRSYNFIERASKVPGIVKEYRTGQSRDVDDNSTFTIYLPVFEYHYNGVDYTYEQPWGTSEKELNVGDQVQLLIDPDKPTEPQQNRFMENWFLPMLLGSIGLVFAGVGMIVMRAFRKP